MTSIEKMGPDDFKALRDYIYEQSGLFFSESKVYFVESRVSKRMKELGMTVYMDYLSFVKRLGNKKEQYKLFDSVTTNETSFYRNPPQVDAFADQILALAVDKAKSRGQTMLKIWSAACSSGEEPYTLAMILEDKKLQLKGLRPVIYGTDISQEILAKAEAASYNEYTMRNLSDKFKRNYFQKDGQNFSLLPQAKGLVKLSYFNLVDYQGYSRFRNMDVIFCRNVLIYFDLKVKRDIIQGFYESLNKGGYLLIGHSESLHNINRDFKMEHYPRALAYLRPDS